VALLPRQRREVPGTALIPATNRVRGGGDTK
jgi:hypothetical protein